jgi:hypothetical protein
MRGYGPYTRQGWSLAVGGGGLATDVCEGRVWCSLQIKLHALLFRTSTPHRTTSSPSPPPPRAAAPPPPPARHGSPSQSAGCSTAARSTASQASSAVHHSASKPCISDQSPQQSPTHLRALALSVHRHRELLHFFERRLGLLCRLLQQVVVYPPGILAIRL